MGIPNWILASGIALTALPADPSGARSTLDGHPAVTRYLSNEAPFVVFGVTPTSLGAASSRLTLTFIATDTLEQVHVFPFVRRWPDGPARMRSRVACGPRDAGSWDCTIPVADLLRDLGGSDGEFGLRIEAHGDLHERGQHSTVIVTLPVRRLPAAASR